MIRTYEKLGKLVKFYRKEKHLTTSTLAENLDVSVGLINNIENGRNDVFKLELFEKLIKELDIPLEELFNIHPMDLYTVIESYRITAKEQISINVNLNQIIETYLDTISRYDYDIESIEYITTNLITTLNTMKNLKARSSL
jgi:transcriptional regulator with XRE-family HTH domain